MVEGTGLPFIIIFVIIPAAVIFILGALVGFFIGRKSK